jgi:desampylase
MWVMQLRISSQHLAQLRLWAKAAGQTECCGLLFGESGQVAHIALTRNVAENPERAFEIDPAALIAAEKAARAGGMPIIGYFHSHPNGNAQPSVTDSAMAADDNRFWLIIGKEHVTAWLPVADEPYIVQFQPVQLCDEG